MVTTSTKTPDAGLEDNNTESVSKTQRKREMHALQSLGESLVAIDHDRLVQLDLPETLFDAIVEAGKITARGAKARQFQYIGRLMRGIDVEPIRRQLDLWTEGSARHGSLVKSVEQWREALLTTPTKFDELVARYPALDRQALSQLIETTHRERAKNQSPTAYRRLFRLIRDTFSANEARIDPDDESD